jgi:pimeloyl-ACP methyl ester carboxylesterase
VADGYVAFTTQETTEFTAQYTPSAVPNWDARHLVWIWARMRNEYAFFPWHRAGLDIRVDVDLPSPATLHERLLDWLRAGEAYRIGYRAAFRFRGDRVIVGVRCPTLLVTMRPDPLVAHLDRLPPLAAHVVVERTGWERTELLERARAFLRRHLGSLPATPAPVVGDPIEARLRRSFVDAGGVQLFGLSDPSGAGRPIVLLHEGGQSSNQALTLAAALATKRPVLALDRPGHGESDAAQATEVEILAAALQPWGKVDLVGLGGGGGLALRMAELRSVNSLTLIDPPAIAADEFEHWVASGAGRLVPDGHGGYLLAAWHRARDAALFEPWFERSRASAVHREVLIDSRMVHVRAVDLLKSLGGSEAVVADWRALTTMVLPPAARVLFTTEGNRRRRLPGLEFASIAEAAAALLEFWRT